MLDVYSPLGSAQPVANKCAGSAIVPANYMSGGAPPAPLAGPTGTSEKKFPTALVVGGLVVGGVLLYYASQVGGLLAANPKCRLEVRQHPDGSWGVAQNGKMFPRKFERKSDAVAWRGGMGNECVPGFAANPAAWGEPYGNTYFQTLSGRLLQMRRKGQRVRFFDIRGQQVGLEQPNVAPALAYADYMKWKEVRGPRENPKPRKKKLSELEQLQASLTRQWTRSKLIEDVAPLVRAAGTPGGRPVVFLVKSKTSAAPTERMIDQNLPGAKASGTDQLSNAKFVHSTLSYAGILAEAGTGRPLVFYDAQEAARGNTLFGLVELREKFPRQPVLMVGYTDWREDDAHAVQLAAAALGARLIVQEESRWYEYVPGAVSNPRESIRRIVSKAGWSYGLAQDQLKSDGVARMINRLLYVLTDDSGDTVPSDPREPVVVGVYALDDAAGEWVQVGDGNFPDLRSALQGWQGVEIDVEEVQRVSEGDFNPGYASNPGRAQQAGFTRSDADPGQLRMGVKHELEHTGSRRVAERIALDHLAEDSRYYDHLDAMEAQVTAEEEPWGWWRSPRPYDNPCGCGART
jgi:hypothetical protein